MKEMDLTLLEFFTQIDHYAIIGIYYLVVSIPLGFCMFKVNKNEKITVIMMSVLLLPIIPLNVYLEDIRLENHQCFLHLVNFPVNHSPETIESLNRELALIEHSLTIATKYKANNTSKLETEKKNILEELDIISKYRGKEAEFPKLMEFMVVDQDKFGVTIISEDNKIYFNRELIRSNNFKRTDCSAKMTQFSGGFNLIVRSKDIQ